MWPATLTSGPLGKDVPWDGSVAFSQFWSWRDASPKTGSCNKNTMYGSGINEMNESVPWLNAAVNAGLRNEMKNLDSPLGF